jgi:small-conductance mechanosensitive channel
MRRNVASVEIRDYDSGQRSQAHQQPPEAAERMLEIFYLLINYPALIAVPILVFAALALWSRSRTVWIAAIAWVVYLGYEIGINTGTLCSGQGCIKRSELYVVYPLLTFVSLVALVQAYVHIRDRRLRLQRPATLRH